MTRIVYGVSGEGSGHSSRAREMLTHLVALGHDVRVVSYDRGARNLKDDFPVHEITGLHIVSRNNKVSVPATVRRNVGALGALRRSWASVGQLIDEFQPHVIITDFEPMTAYAARRRDIPLITIDNQHRMRYMNYPPVPRARVDGAVTRTVIRLFVPRPRVSLITTFYFGETTDPRAELFPPILRQRVREAEPADGDHVLVYVTQAFDSLIDALKAFPDQPFRVYGFDREGEEGNLAFRPFSVAGFLDDLRSARGVVATAGFTLMTEALYLRRPLLALPMLGQYEQRLNAHLLSHLGYGMAANRVTPEVLGGFLGQLDRYREGLGEYPRDAGDAIKARLAALVADNARLLRESAAPVPGGSQG
ncbi:MAG: MJ1255/VC2487 family glycosyltransferase [Pseudomonadota bacterium]